MSRLDYMVAPFPYFGGKGRVVDKVWERFGQVRNYVEPFFGSGAVLLGRPGGADVVETVNDVDGLVCNFWRGVRYAPGVVAKWADWPVNENDLHARHVWLLGRKGSLRERLEGDPEYFDARAAGWWCWGACCWIGGGWCSGEGGPWVVVDGKLVKREMGKGDREMDEILRKRPLLGHTGLGVHRKLVHLGDQGLGVHQSRISLGSNNGIRRQLVHLGNVGQGIQRRRVYLGGHGVGIGVHWMSGRSGVYEWFEALSGRLRGVRVCCGDFERVLGQSVTLEHGLTGVFLDPPYGLGTGRDEGLYGSDDYVVAGRAAAWAREHGSDPRFRIALCGYVGEHDMPGDWECFRWSTRGGYANQRRKTGGDLNRNRECIWFSPGCLKVELF